MAPLVHAMRADSDHFDVQVCVTAQHRQMLDQVLQLFNIEPDIDLNLMRPDQDLFDLTASTLMGMRDVFVQSKPEALLVHGDTTTALAAAMAGFYAGVPVGHIEAGLRTYNLHAPFPEELNRQIVSKLTSWHFAPTSLSQKNLLAEGVFEGSTTVTGNTVIDALHWVLARIDDDELTRAELIRELNTILRFDWRTERFVLVTGHRRENFGYGFLQICSALGNLARAYPAVHFVYPVHLNPNVSKPVHAMLGALDNLHLIMPQGYGPFVYLLKHAYLVLTDSGGIQEEAPSLGKPVLVMRDVTERPEAVDAGIVELVGANEQHIISGVSRLLDDAGRYQMMSQAQNPYGDGMASQRILEFLRHI